MENICKNCKHWLLPTKEDDYWGSQHITKPYDEENDFEPMTEEKQRELFGFNVRYCRSPKIIRFERPAKDGATVVDGSEYMANFITGEDFGCIHFEKVHT